MRYKKIIGGTQKGAEEKFPWLKDAAFKDAEIDIRWQLLVWKGGIWEDGIWKGGIWKGGIWEGGTWEDGIWEGGIWQDGVWESGVWKGGKMWSNLQQKYIRVLQKNGKFKEAQG